jgi:hypothetical protein
LGKREREPAFGSREFPNAELNADKRVYQVRFRFGSGLDGSSDSVSLFNRDSKIGWLLMMEDIQEIVW